MQKLEGRDVKILASKETLGCNNLYMLVAFFPPKKHSLSHIHDIAEEVIYCLQGKGEIVIDGIAINVEPGITVYTPPKKLHSVNTGIETIKLLCMFLPSIKVGEYKEHNNE